MARGPAWSDEADTKLKQLAADGKSAAQISNEMGRSTSSVRKRADLLRLSLKKIAQKQRPSDVPTFLERSAIDAIISQRNIPMGVGRRTMGTLLAKGWIEQHDEICENTHSYRVTSEGIAAVRRKIPIEP